MRIEKFPETTDKPAAAPASEIVKFQIAGVVELILVFPPDCVVVMLIVVACRGQTIRQSPIAIKPESGD